MRRPASLIAVIAGIAALAWTACVQVPADRRDPATFPDRRGEIWLGPAAATTGIVGISITAPATATSAPTATGAR
jgi:hypothetical protein